MTGASSGIGRAIAVELARAGADVLVHGFRSPERGRETVELVRACGRKSEWIAADLTDDGDQFQTFLEESWKRLQNIPTIWVNNAGADILTTSSRTSDYARKLALLLQIDVTATMLLSRGVAERMRDAGGGVILNIGWDQAERGMGGESGELFSAAKSAVMGFSRSLAVSFAPTVRVNCIAPGWIRTAWGETAPAVWQERVLHETPLGRWGEPEDIARLARFLVSHDAAYLTGQVIYANGGAER